MELQRLYEYRLAHGLMATESVVDAAVQQRERRVGKGEKPRRRMVDMYEVSGELKLTGPFRIFAQIPATPAVVVGIPKALKRADRVRDIFPRRRQECADCSRVSASLNAHVSNGNESFSSSFPYRHRTGPIKSIRSN